MTKRTYVLRRFLRDERSRAGWPETPTWEDFMFVDRVDRSGWPESAPRAGLVRWESPVGSHPHRTGWPITMLDMAARMTAMWAAVKFVAPDDFMNESIKQTYVLGHLLRDRAARVSALAVERAKSEQQFVNYAGVPVEFRERISATEAQIMDRATNPRYLDLVRARRAEAAASLHGPGG